VNAVKAGAVPGSPPMVATAVEALRGIGRRQVAAAVLLGLALFVADALSYFSALFVVAKPISVPVLLANMVVAAQARAFALMAAIVIADHAVDLGAPRLRAYVASALGGGVLGVLLDGIVSWPFLQWMMANAWPAGWLRGIPFELFRLVKGLATWLPIASAIVFLYADRRTARRTEASLQAAERNRIRASRTALESRLQAMQARVEPQFLFNTLAQVERLYEVDSALAGRMLDDLIAYLRAAMPAMRDTSSTVGQEVDLARAYLDIVRLRLGDRLRVAIDVPADVRDARMPPMMLLPLTDHAVTHGIEQRRGGMLHIAIEARPPRLVLRIVDSGAGFIPEVAGDGIADIRARLATLYGPEATLALQPRGSGASEAILDLPLESCGGAGGVLPIPA